MLARAVTHALVGLEARRVEVEADVRAGLPAFVIVGLPDRACAEARQRVRSGITSAELEFPPGRVTVNLAPAGLRKEGSGYDLPIALAVLAASRQLPHDELDRHASVGELALDGRLRRVGGILAVAEGARRMGLERVLCPTESAAEAALAGIEPVAFRHLADTVAYLRGELEPDPLPPPPARGRRRGAARPRRRPRPGTGTAGPRARRGRRAQPAARRPARNGQDDARAPPPRDPASARAGGGARGDADPLRRRSAAARRAARSGCRRFARRTTARPRRRSSAAEPAFARVRRASRIAASSSSTSSPSSRGRRSKGCGSRSRTASSRSRVRPGARSSPRASSSSRR